MTYERIIEKINNGEKFFLFKYEGMHGRINYGYPGKKEKEDKCWEIYLMNPKDPDLCITAYRNQEGLTKENFDKWVNRIKL